MNWPNGLPRGSSPQTVLLVKPGQTRSNRLSPGPFGQGSPLPLPYIVGSMRQYHKAWWFASTANTTTAMQSAIRNPQSAIAGQTWSNLVKAKKGNQSGRDASPRRPGAIRCAAGRGTDSAVPMRNRDPYLNSYGEKRLDRQTPNELADLCKSPRNSPETVVYISIANNTGRVLDSSQGKQHRGLQREFPGRAEPPLCPELLGGAAAPPYRGHEDFCPEPR